MKLRNIGQIGWYSQDFDGSELRAAPGQEVEMSDARAEKVLRDFPARFALVEMFVTLAPVALAEFEVTADPADTSAAGIDVPVVTTESVHVTHSAGRRRRRRSQS